jgi:hypothetical protein
VEKAGRLMPVEDSYFAATARRYSLTIATGNDQDFRRPRLKVFNRSKSFRVAKVDGPVLQNIVEGVPACGECVPGIWPGDTGHGAGTRPAEPDCWPGRPKSRTTTAPDP